MKSVLDWAKEYVGEPESHVSRGTIIVEYMQELGLKPEHRVLDIGCGALSQGQHLIRYLNVGNYVGIDPAGWLWTVAYDEDEELWDKSPTFLSNSDFTADQGSFDFVVAHSVMSHMAFWQMQQALANVRKSVNEGAIWLSSLRIDQYDDFSDRFLYPDITRFRLQTVQTLGFYHGWIVMPRHDLRERLVANHPSDSLEWITLTAIPTSSEMNDRRLQLEADIAEDRLNKETERELRETFGKARLAAMAELPPELQR